MSHSVPQSELDPPRVEEPARAVEDARHRAIVPVSRRTTSAAAMSGDLAEQLTHLPTEAAVRQES